MVVSKQKILVHHISQKKKKKIGWDNSSICKQRVVQNRSETENQGQSQSQQENMIFFLFLLLKKKFCFARIFTLNVLQNCETVAGNRGNGKINRIMKINNNNRNKKKKI